MVPVRHDASVSPGTSPALLVSARQILRGPVTDRIDDGAVLAVDGTIVAVGPRAEVVAAAPPDTEHHDHPDATLPPPGGHCHVLGGVVDGPVAIAERIAEHAAAGVDLIKVMASGGQSTAGGAAMWESQFDRAELALVVDEAARHGLGVAAHAHGAQAIADAVAAGVATVEHCTWMSGPGTSDQRPEVVAEMAQRGI